MENHVSEFWGNSGCVLRLKLYNEDNLIMAEVLIRDIKVICTAPEGINLVVVKIETTEPELFGLGCATFAYRHLSVKRLIEEYFVELLVGKPVHNINEIWQLLHQNAYWRNGPITNNAISGIDMALWDIKGKLANMPLYELFGGSIRKGVPVYRHVEGKDVQEVCDLIEYYKSLGIKHVRCQCGGYGGTGYQKAPVTAPKGSVEGVYFDSKKYVRDTIQLFEGIRAKVGFDVELIHDVHERIDPIDAIQLARQLEPCHLFFLEDPVALEFIDWLQELRTQSAIPIAQGELFNNVHEWKYIISNKLIDYMRIHLSQIGGITPARNLQIFAQHFGVKTAWHGPGDMSPIGHAANIHIDLVAPNFGIQEWSGMEPPNFIIQKINSRKGALLDVFPTMLTLENGFVYPNNRPGIGIDINEKEAQKYPCNKEVTRWTITRKLDGSLQAP